MKSRQNLLSYSLCCFDLNGLYGYKMTNKRLIFEKEYLLNKELKKVMFLYMYYMKLYCERTKIKIKIINSATMNVNAMYCCVNQ